MTIRRARAEDMPFMRQVAIEAYGEGFFEQPASDRWVLQMMLSANALVQRGDRAWTASTIACFPWAPSRLNGSLVVAASLGGSYGELIGMVRAAMLWSKGFGAAKFYFSASTGVDFGPLAKRIGAGVVSPNYAVEL